MFFIFMLLNINCIQSISPQNKIEEYFLNLLSITTKNDFSNNDSRDCSSEFFKMLHQGTLFLDQTRPFFELNTLENDKKQKNIQWSIPEVTLFLNEILKAYLNSHPQTDSSKEEQYIQLAFLFALNQIEHLACIESLQDIYIYMKSIKGLSFDLFSQFVDLFYKPFYLKVSNQFKSKSYTQYHPLLLNLYYFSQYYKEDIKEIRNIPIDTTHHKKTLLNQKLNFILHIYPLKEGLDKAILHHFNLYNNDEQYALLFPTYFIRNNLLEFIKQYNSFLSLPPLGSRELLDIANLLKVEGFQKIFNHLTFDNKRIKNIPPFHFSYMAFLFISIGSAFQLSEQNSENKKDFKKAMKFIRSLPIISTNENTSELIFGKNPTIDIYTFPLDSFLSILIDFYAPIYFNEFNSNSISEIIGFIQSPKRKENYLPLFLIIDLIKSFRYHPFTSLIDYLVKNKHFSNQKQIACVEKILEELPFSEQTIQVICLILFEKMNQGVSLHIQKRLKEYLKKSKVNPSDYHNNLQILFKECFDFAKKITLNNHLISFSSYQWISQKGFLIFPGEGNLLPLMNIYLLASHAIPIRYLTPHIPIRISQKILTKEEFEKIKSQLGHHINTIYKGRTITYSSEKSPYLICVKIKKENEIEELFFQELDTMMIVQEEAQKIGIPYTQTPLGRLYSVFEKTNVKALVYLCHKDSFIYTNEIDKFRNQEGVVKAIDRGLTLYAHLGTFRHLYYHQVCGLAHTEDRPWHMMNMLFLSLPGSIRETDFQFPNMTKESIRDSIDFWRPQQSAFDSFPQKQFDQVFIFTLPNTDPLFYYNTPLHQAFSSFLMLIEAYRDIISCRDFQQINKYGYFFCRFFTISLSTFHQQNYNDIFSMIQQKYLPLIHQGLAQLFYYIDPLGLKNDVELFDHQKNNLFQSIYGQKLTKEIVQYIKNDCNLKKNRMYNLGLFNSSFPSPQLIQVYLHLLAHSIILGEGSNDLKEEDNTLHFLKDITSFSFKCSSYA